MDLTPADRRLLKIISQNIILSTHVSDGDVIEPGSGKRVIPEDTAERFVELGLAAWSWDEAYEEYRFVLTEKGTDALEASTGTQ